MGCWTKTKDFFGVLIPIVSTGLFFYGCISEIIDDMDVYHALGDSKYDDTHTKIDRQWLYAIIILYCISFSIIGLLVACGGCVGCLTSCSDDDELKQKYDSLKVLLEIEQATITFIIFYKIAVYGSILNKLRAQGLWEGSSDFSLYAIAPSGLFGTESGSTFEDKLKRAIQLSAFNMWRTAVLFIPTFCVRNGSFLRKILWQIMYLIPSAIVVTIFGVKMVSSGMVFHLTQRHYCEDGHFTTTTNINLAAVSYLFTISILFVFFGIIVGKLNSFQAKHADDYDATPDEPISKAAKYYLYTVLLMAVVIDVIVPFAAVLNIYNTIGIWNPYMTIDITTTSAMWAFSCVGCCVTWFKFCRHAQDYADSPLLDRN